MASDGSKGPRPYTQRQARTLFVRVPSLDWPQVKRGLVGSFVGSIGRQSALFDVVTPTPCVAYSVIRGNHDCRLMLLDDVRQEVLGAIEPSRLGFDSMAEFRRYWMLREHRKFPPTRKVFLYTIRPWDESMAPTVGANLLRHLYGEFM
jgi:hypothetical protein